MAGKTSSDPNVFILPDLGEGVHEAELIAWKVKPGDTVAEHEVIAEMETDKALVEVPSPRAGVIKTLHGDEGEILHVGNALVTYEGGDGAASVTPAPSQNGAAKKQAEPADVDEDQGTVVGAVSADTPGMNRAEGKALAAPAVRKLARDVGVDIDSVPGTGIGGRVTAKDVHSFKDSGGPAKPGKPTPATAATETRRPMPNAAPPPPAPAYQPAPNMPQPMQPLAGYGQQPGYMPYPQMQAPMPYPPMMVMMPMPMPGMYGMPGMAPPAGVPMAPGYTGPMVDRPIPDPAQSSQIGAGQASASQPFRGVRRTIAERLRQSVSTAVHFTVMDEADVTLLDEHRKQLAQASGRKISFLPLVAQAVCRSLAADLGGRFGALNATVDEQASEIVQHRPVHLGIATDTDSGLMVPVIRDAERMDAATMAGAIADTASAARDRSLDRTRLMGSTFTISNVGSHAGKFATPVINVPEVAILAVGKVYDGVVVRNGQAMVGKLMPLSLACDHRVVDGATAALCLAEIVRTLQDPSALG